MMLATFVATVFVPLFYVLLATLGERLARAEIIGRRRCRRVT